MHTAYATFAEDLPPEKAACRDVSLLAGEQKVTPQSWQDLGYGDARFDDVSPTRVEKIEGWMAQSGFDIVTRTTLSKISSDQM